MPDDLLRLAADLGEAKVRVGKKAADVVRKSAKKVTRIAKQKAPKRTGKLANSIGFDVLGSGHSHKSMVAVIGPTEYYGMFQEYGTSKMAPNPFMSPALDAVEPGFVSAMEDVVGGVLE